MTPTRAELLAMCDEVLAGSLYSKNAEPDPAAAEYRAEMRRD